MRIQNFLVNKNSEISKNELRFIFIILLLLSFLFYGSSLQNDYNIDDHLAFTQNKTALNGLSDISSIFQKNSFHQDNYSFGYRPISTLSFAIEYEFFGVNSFVSHFINILLYFLSCYLIFFFINSLFPDLDLRASFIISIVFLALPIHSEIVNNVKCRDELLMLLFGLSSSLLFIKSLDKKLWLALPALLLLFFSILSKKTGILFLGIIPLSIFYHKDFTIKKMIGLGLFSSTAVLLIKLLKKSIKSDKNVREYSLIESPLFESSIEVDQLSIALHSFWFYIKKLIYPSELVSYYGFDTIDFNGYDLTSFVSICLVLFLILIGLSAFKNKTELSFGAILFLVGIIPVVNWLIPLVGIVAERFVTIASIGWVILVVSGAIILSKKASYLKTLFRVVFVLFLIGSFIQIQSRNKEWENKFSLFEADVEKEPKSATLQALIGKEYLAKIQTIKNNKEKIRLGKIAISHLEKSTKLVEDYFVLTDLAGLYFRAYGNYDLAIKTYKRVIVIKPNYPDVYYHLAWVYEEQNQPLKAAEHFEKSIELNPKLYVAYEPLIRCLAEMGDFNAALKANKIGMTQFPDERNFILNEANIYYLMKDRENALLWYQKATKLFPNNTEIKKKISSLESINQISIK